MIKRVDLIGKHDAVFGNPAPLGLMGLAIASFALAPLSFGLAPTPTNLQTIAVFALLFGGFCQLLTGLMDFANKNAFGGAIFTVFAFNWMKNALVLYLASQGVLLSHEVEFMVDVTQMVLLAVLTYGFGFFSLTLFLFLLDIDLIFVCKIAAYLWHAQAAMAVPIGVLTVVMGLLATWIALASLMNPVVGRALFKESRPMFHAPRRGGFDWALRAAVFGTLYEHWREHAYEPMPFDALQQKVRQTIGEQSIVPDLFYLAEYGSLVLTFSDTDEKQIAGVRLNANGIDLHEQLVLKKYEF